MLQTITPINRRRRQTILLTLATALATSLLIGGSVLAWRFCSEWRLGRIELTTEGAPVVCQVLAESSDLPIGEPFDLVTRAIVALPAGDYRLRVSGTERLSRTSRFAVNRGETQTHTTSIDEGRLLGGERAPRVNEPHVVRNVPIPFVPMTTAVELTPGKSDLIEWIGQPLTCRDGATGKPRWQSPALPAVIPTGPDGDRARWIKKLSENERTSGPFDPAPDLDGDGTRDLLWSFQGTSALLALSGKDGSLLWNFVAEPDGSGGPRRDVPGMTNSSGLITARDIAGKPAIADLDGDGAPDLVAAFIFSDLHEETQKQSAGSARSPAPVLTWQHRRMVMAVSGRSGRLLWASPVEGIFPDRPQEAWTQPSVVVEGAQSKLVACVDGTKWRGLDPATGRVQAGPFDLGFLPVSPVQFADLDCDGEPEIVALANGPKRVTRTLHALSLKTGRELWVQNVDQPFDQGDRAVPLRDYPLIVDFDNDGRAEIVVADAGALPPAVAYRGVMLLDGLTGTARWRSALRPDTNVADGLADVLPAPDLDGDGTRDLITTSLFAGRNPLTPYVASPDEPRRIYVDALSGKDGRPIWWWKVDAPSWSVTPLWRPHWWGRGSDGWPLLAVPLGGESSLEAVSRFRWDQSRAPPVVHLLEATTGRERHTVVGLVHAGCADLNGDGLADLWGEVNGELLAFRGEAPEAWRALGTFEAADPRKSDRPVARGPAVDLDGDGIADTLIGSVEAPGIKNSGKNETTGSYTAVARSGRDGHVIWKSELDPRERWFEPDSGASFTLLALPLPDGDLDGDGTADIVLKKEMRAGWHPSGRHTATLPLQLLSGRTGAQIWSAGPLPLGFAARGYTQIIRVDARAVESDGPRDLIVCHWSTFVAPGSELFPGPASPGRPNLARISGRDGRIHWDVALADYIGADLFGYAPPLLFHDLNGDGIHEALLVLPAHSSGPHTLLVISLQDGKILWSKSKLRSDHLTGGDVQVGDFDADTRIEVALLDRLDAEVHVYDGRDGKDRWTWKSGIERRGNPSEQWIALADLAGNGRKNLCVQFHDRGGPIQVVVLDGNGKERKRRALAAEWGGTLEAADVNGDGRDELLVWYADALHAWDGDLNDLWSWPDRSGVIDRILPGSQARPGAVILAPALALNGATGIPLWTGQPPLVNDLPQFALKLLDPGDANRRPLLIGQGPGATVCRVAMPATAKGKIATPRGTAVHATHHSNDPRWSRPLPWIALMKGFVGPGALLAAAGLALVNVALPLLVLLLVAGRRRFSVAALMALPVAAAIPLVVFLTFEPWLPVGAGRLLGSEKRVFLAGTLAGLPVAWCTVWIVARLARLRYKPIAAVAGLTVLASLAIAACWIALDMKSMAAIEHFDWSGWYLVLLPGSYVAAVSCLLSRARCSAIARFGETATRRIRSSDALYFRRGWHCPCQRGLNECCRQSVVPSIAAGTKS